MIGYSKSSNFPFFFPDSRDWILDEVTIWILPEGPDRERDEREGWGHFLEPPRCGRERDGVTSRFVGCDAKTTDYCLSPFGEKEKEIPIVISIFVSLFYEKNAKKSFFFAKKLQTQDTTLPFLLPILEKIIFKTSSTICYRINSVFHVFLAHFLV